MLHMNMMSYLALEKPCADGVVVIAISQFPKVSGSISERGKKRNMLVEPSSGSFRSFSGITSPWRAILGWAKATYLGTRDCLVASVFGIHRGEFWILNSDFCSSCNVVWNRISFTDGGFCVPKFTCAKNVAIKTICCQSLAQIGLGYKVLFRGKLI